MCLVTANFWLQQILKKVFAKAEAFAPHPTPVMDRILWSAKS
jgi:hypothetical protein